MKPPIGFGHISSGFHRIAAGHVALAIGMNSTDNVIDRGLMLHDASGADTVLN